jgi:hypothetical protein
VRQENAEIPNSPALQKYDERLNGKHFLSVEVKQIIQSLRSSPWHFLEKKPYRSGNVRGQPCFRYRLRGVGPGWF